MTYEDVYQVIARYCERVLSYFADGWSRWPDTYMAKIIITALKSEEAFWEPRDKATWRLIRQAIDAIDQHRY